MILTMAIPMIKRVLPSIFILLLLIGAVLISGCVETDEKNEPAPAGTHTQPILAGGMNEYVNLSNAFAFDIYPYLSDDGANTFYSPYSISTALGMAYEGARGETAAEMRAVLDLPTDDDARQAMVGAVQQILNEDDPAFDLATANAYWLDEGGALLETYRRVLEDYYFAHGERLDFAGDPAGAVQRINSWVEERTEERIEDLLSTSDINPLTYLILTNAIYFRSDWKYQFDPDATDTQPFTLANGTTVEAETMHMCDETIAINYTETDDVQCIRLPYRDEALSMYILLPTASSTGALEAKLDDPYFSALKRNLTGQWVDISLPSFILEERYDLNAVLSAMGMPTAFGGAANFSGITSEADLFISKVIHQSFVEVNEEGTEAAAATAVVMDRLSAGSSSHDPIIFRADHPFIFVIEHHETGQILFMGKLGQPN